MNKLKSIITIISNDPKQSVISFTIIGKVNMPEKDSSKNMIKDIQISEATEIVKSFKGSNELVILDVRTADEYNNGCLEDAVNINFTESNFKKMIKLLDKQKTYLVYCQSGIRSKHAIELMSEMGFNKVYHMNEGIEGWKAKHLKIVDPNL
ncbi:MAG: rhodanese-like domain-containing protein [Candidatus Tenebribacter burtonii]|jgi:rhodanese-related sulfurtransferase|nr:rhodanese-like domain-containing protein [Candidatus Tenebribacter burtonii]